jgi:hypothetical protein
MKKKPIQRTKNQSGYIALVLVTLIMVSLLIGVSISEWVSIQRQGSMRMRLANKQNAMARTAVQETILAILDGRIPNSFTATQPPLNFSHHTSSSTMHVAVQCFPYP